MFWQILMKSLRHRWSRIAVAVLAVTMGASLAAAALSVSVGMEEKVGKTLRAYGANITLIPKSAALGASNATLKESDLTALAQTPSVLSYAPFLYAVAEAAAGASGGNQPVALVGTWFDAAMRVNPWWEIVGTAPARDDSTTALVGTNVAAKWHIQVGDQIPVQYRDSGTTVHVTGILNTGGAEDDEILVSLAAAQALTQRPGQVSLVQVSALDAQTPIEATTSMLEQAIPDAQAKTVRQLAEGEVVLVRRVQLLLALIAAIVLIAAVVSVAATMTTVMLERQREIGLMKALGAEVRRVRALFLAEAGAIGVAGGVAGYVFGFALAQIIAQSVFASAVAPNLWVGLSALSIALIVALLGAAVPVQRALNVEAAVVLRGE